MKMLFIDAKNKTVSTVEIELDNSKMLETLGNGAFSVREIEIDDEILVVGDYDHAPGWGFKIAGNQFSGNGLWRNNPERMKVLRDPDDLAYQIKFFNANTESEGDE